jgi:glutamate-1-semialdehyde 2,1-aminomutase
MKMDKSRQIAERTRKVVPGAVMSNWRKSEGYQPLFISHGEGSRLWDVDGNVYIDYCLSFGPAILGHSNEHVRQAMEKQMHRLYANEPTELQYQAAEKIVKHVASAEQVRFANTGTEANLNILRVARAYAGRNYFVRFNGHYIGSTDALIGGVVNNPDFPVPEGGVRDGDFLSEMGNTVGRAEHAFTDSFMLEWNDLGALDKLFKDHGDKIAAVIMEPVMVNFSGCYPEPGYLEGVRKRCTEYGVVLVFDEVLTGFRIGLKSAQGHFGVTPDMTTLAKSLGGGFPVSAFCGKKEIMDLIAQTKVIGGGTYNGHPVAMAAVKATIEELEKDNGAVYDTINRLGRRLKEGLLQISRQVGSNLLLQGFPGAWTFTFSDKNKIINHRDSLDEPNGMIKAAKFGSLLKERGVLTLFRFCTSAAHTDQDVDDTLNRAEDALRQLEKEGI